MAIGSAASDNFRASLAASGGSAIMVASFRQWTWAFLGFVGAVLATLAYSSWRVRPWAWPMTLVVYGVGVLGSLWQVSVGIPQGWVAASVNAAVFIYVSTPSVTRLHWALICHVAALLDMSVTGDASLIPDFHLCVSRQ
jgi:hypothetical protein